MTFVSDVDITGSGAAQAIDPLETGLAQDDVSETVLDGVSHGRGVESKMNDGSSSEPEMTDVSAEVSIILLGLELDDDGMAPDAFFSSS